MKKSKWTEEDISSLKSMYFSRTTTKEIANVLGRSVFSVRTKLCELNISGRGKVSETKEIFENLEDDLLGYISGLFASDGNLEKSTNRVSISLKREDRDTVNMIASSLMLVPKIREDRGQVVFKASLPMFRAFLEDLGLTPNKSKSMNINLSGKSTEFKLGFVAGIIAGDGCISTALSNKYTYRVSVTSASDIFSEQILEVVNDLFDVEGVIHRRGCNEIIWHTKKSIPILKYLVDLPFFMERKRTKALRYLDYYNAR